jgi:hypothetical protein
MPRLRGHLVPPGAPRAGCRGIRGAYRAQDFAAVPFGVVYAIMIGPITSPWVPQERLPGLPMVIEVTTVGPR